MNIITTLSSIKSKKEDTFQILLFCLCCLFFTSLSYSQNSQLQNFNTKEGLPQSQVYDIVQDSIGYLWLATQGGGLARFDGDEFTVFNEKKGLKSNFVNSLLVRNDSLFIGTYSGLSIYTKGRFKNYESPKINKVVAINQSIYLATDKGIYSYKNDSLQPISSVTKVDLNTVTDIIKEGPNYLIATKKGLWVLDQINNPKKAVKIDASDYTSFLKLENRILASTFDAGIKIIDSGKIVGVQKDIQRSNKIYLIDNQYWIASDTDGIIVTDNRFRTKQVINQNNGLAINQIRSIIKDNQENIWIGTSGGGLYKLTQNNFQHFDRNSGLKGNRIYAVHKKDHEIWISNSEKGVIKIDSLGIYPILEDNGYLNNVKVKTIASDGSDNVWVGTDGKGILIFKKKYIELDSLQKESKFDVLDKKLFPEYTLETDTLTIEDGLTSNWIKKIKIRNDIIWIATYSSGIIQMRYGKMGISPSVSNYYGTKKGIKDLFINDLKIDNKGRVWYATREGNLGYINQKGQVRDFYRILNKEISISTILFKDQNIYLGTLGDGIWIANAANPREVKQLSGVKNLNSNNIYQLIFDNENNLWVGTEKGVNKVVLDANNSISDVFYFDRSDGFLGIETCQNSVDIDFKGNIWFGTMNGLTKYIPTNNQLKKAKPTIYFENIEVAYQPVDSLNINAFSEILQLKTDENHLSFQFKSIDINHPKGIEYRWKLNHGELEGDYGPWSSKDFIDFANLKDGNYEFSVQARNIDWIQSDVINFQFFIDKPLYQKSWFLWVIYSSLGLIALIIILVTVKRIKRKNKQKLEQLTVENHLLSLEQKALQLQMNPHFIFNVLNGIKAMGSVGETEQMNSTINTFATLLRSILNSSRQEEVSLQEEIKTLENYLTLEQQMSVKKFEYQVHTATNGINIEEILIPPMLIQPFVENSVKHGFQQIERNGKIDIKFVVNGEFLECEVRDNGIGIEQSKQQKKSHHPSTALKVTKERIQSLSKEHSLIIKEENGTIVSFRLPLKTDF
ncbi:two-component regulator propeller domain-containing protein [Pseudotenacibaculum sp. MALMAid0570]|uniref:ligand-binding sensor domain-containing protein n=1 Tax=Pseudotenacibaculum sp. MALMAid0570 TaxID=3143938 RepID=UPI0032E03186